MDLPVQEVSSALEDFLARPVTSVLEAFLVPSVLAVSKVTRATGALLAPLATLGQLVHEAYQGREDSPALPADLAPSVPLVPQARAGQSVLEVSPVPGAQPENRAIKASLAMLVYEVPSVLVASAVL